MASLVEGLKASREAGSRFILFGLSASAREVLKISRLLKLFEIYDDEEQAISTLQLFHLAKYFAERQKTACRSSLKSAKASRIASLTSVPLRHSENEQRTMVLRDPSKDGRRDYAVLFHRQWKLECEHCPSFLLITFFIGLILALQSAYRLSKLGALNLVAKAVALSMSRNSAP